MSFMTNNYSSLLAAGGVVTVVSLVALVFALKRRRVQTISDGSGVENNNNHHPQPIVHVTPTLLEFDEAAGQQQMVINVQNLDPNNKALAIKIKTTCSARYSVSPHETVLRPGAETRIVIRAHTSTKSKEDVQQIVWDKFMVVAIPIESHEVTMLEDALYHDNREIRVETFKQFWTRKDSDQSTQVFLSSKFKTATNNIAIHDSSSNGKATTTTTTTAHPTSCLVTVNTNMLQFTMPSSLDPPIATFRVSNDAQGGCAVFKVMTTRPTCFSVNPTEALLAPGQSQDVTVVVCKSSSSSNSTTTTVEARSAKFKVVAVPISVQVKNEIETNPGEKKQIFQKVWASADEPKVMRLQVDGLF